MQDNARILPKIHLVMKNRLTHYMGDASAYQAVLAGIDTDLEALIEQYPQHFNFNSPDSGTVNVKDFGTTGVVAFARGCPFDRLPTGRLAIGGPNGRRVRVNSPYRTEAIEHIDRIVAKLY